MNQMSFADYASKQIALKEIEQTSPINLMFRKREVEEIEPKKQVQVNLTLPYFENPDGFESTIHETMSLIEEQYRWFVTHHLGYLGLSLEDLIKPIEFDRNSASCLLYEEVEHHLTHLFDSVNFSKSNGDVITQYDIDIPRLATMITNYGEPRLLCNVFYYVWWYGKGVIDGEDFNPDIDWFFHYREEITRQCWIDDDESLSDATSDLLFRINEEINDFNRAITNPTASIETAIIRLLEKGFFNCSSDSDNDIPFEREVAPWDEYVEQHEVEVA